jgi:hypothetical protein
VVCKRFYDISCYIRDRSFKMTIKDPQFYDLVKYKSMRKTKRKINTIRIGRNNYHSRLYSVRLKKVLRSVGVHVTKLVVHEQNISTEGFDLLNLMPNLQSITLNELREFKLSNCKSDVIEIFNRLPRDVLLKLTLDSVQGSQEYRLRNQRNIIEAIVVNSNLDFLDLQETKLKKLCLTKSKYTIQNIESQNELKELHTDNFGQIIEIVTVQSFITGEIKEIEVIFKMK